MFRIIKDAANLLIFQAPCHCVPTPPPPDLHLKIASNYLNPTKRLLQILILSLPRVFAPRRP